MHASALGGQPFTAPRSPGGGGEGRGLPPCLATATYEADGSRVRVTVRGELDLDSQRTLRSGLLKALADSATGLDVDLSGLGFCDCAGFSVLLELRKRALSQNKTVVIRATSPATDRLLSLLRARELFIPPRDATHTASPMNTESPAAPASSAASRRAAAGGDPTASPPPATPSP